MFRKLRGKTPTRLNKNETRVQPTQENDTTFNSKPQGIGSDPHKEMTPPSTQNLKTLGLSLLSYILLNFLISTLLAPVDCCSDLMNSTK